MNRNEYLSTLHLPIKEVVEVGVLRGKYSSALLAGLNPDKLYLVDPWKSYEGYSDYAKSGAEEWEARYQTVASKFRNDARVKIIREESVPASTQFKDGSLGMVYIDANHDYEYVKADLEAWVPKVVSGGIIAGHDYSPISTPGVVQAVQEVLGVTEAELFITTEERGFARFFFYVKP